MGKTEEVLDRLGCFQRLRNSRISVNLPINFVDEIAELLKEQKQRIEALTFDRDVLANDVSYHNCNTCKTPCDYRPQPGERVRANCIGWHGE